MRNASWNREAPEGQRGGAEKSARRTAENQTRQLAELAEKYAEEKTRAEDANRAKSEFLANISHELRTPLNAIIGFSEIMKGEMFGPLGAPKYGEYTHDIHHSGSYLLGVINDILDMSRIEAGQVDLSMETVDLAELFNEATRIMTPIAAEKSITLVSEHHRGHAHRGRPPRDEADPPQPHVQRGEVHPERRLRDHPRTSWSAMGGGGGRGQRHRHPQARAGPPRPALRAGGERSSPRPTRARASALPSPAHSPSCTAARW